MKILEDKRYQDIVNNYNEIESGIESEEDLRDLCYDLIESVYVLLHRSC